MVVTAFSVPLRLSLLVSKIKMMDGLISYVHLGDEFSFLPVCSILGFQLFGHKPVSAKLALKLLTVHREAFGKRKFVDEVKFRGEEAGQPAGFRSMHYQIKSLLVPAELDASGKC